MADNINKEDVQNSERLLDLSNQIIDAYTQRKKLLKGINAEEQLFFATVKQQQKLSQDISANAEKYIGYQIKSKDLSKQIKSAEDNANKSKLAFNKDFQSNITKQYQDTIKANSKILEQITNENKSIKKTSAALDESKQKLNDLYKAQQKGEAVTRIQFLRAKVRVKQITEELDMSDNLVKNLTKQNEHYNGVAGSLADIVVKQNQSKEQQAAELAFLNKNLVIRKRIERSTGLLGGLAKSLSKIPGIGTYLRADEAIDEMEKLAAKIEEAGGKSTSFGNRLQIGLKGASVLAKGFIENIKSPEAIFTFLGKAVLNANKQTVDLGKSLGVSKNQVIGIREEFVKYSAYADSTFITTDRLLKAQSELSNQLGIAVQFSGKETENFARLTELTGLSADEAGKLAKVSAAVGQEIGDYTDSIRESALYAERTTKTHFSSKQILQEVSKLSAGILVKFQGNPKAIAEAVVQAKKLGTNLETIDKIGDSLLNWESSIGNQLEAQLITGKQLNLERARYAALTGNQLDLENEIASQVGSLAEFQQMNVIAQGSLAKAFGLSRNELADMLLQQEAINRYGDAAAKLNKDQIKDFEKQKESRKGLTLKEYLKEQEQQISIQDKFNNAVLKLQDLIGNLVAGPLGGFIDSLTNGLNIITKIFGYFGKIGSAIKGLFGDKVGEAMGGAASVVTIGLLINTLTRSITKGTIFNPMIVKDISGLSGKAGTGNIADLFKGGREGTVARGRMARGGSNLLKGAGKLGGGVALLSAGADLATNLTDPNRSKSNALGKTLDQNKFAALGAGIGSLFGGVGALPGAAIGSILDSMLGDATQIVQDGIAPKSKGPFTVIDSYGGIGKTSKGDNLTASPNLNKSITPSLDLSPMIQAINEVKNAISSLADRPIYTTITLDGKALGTAVGSQQETGTAQNIYTGYKVA